MKKQKFLPGFDEKSAQELIAHYENQTDDEEFADINAAREAEEPQRTRVTVLADV
jgi:hypothetical protein